MKFDLGHFKKAHEDHKSATLAHPNGHKIVIAKASLNPKLKKQLAGLPQHFDDGGMAQPQEIPIDTNPSPPSEEDLASSFQQAQPQMQAPDQPAAVPQPEASPARAPAADNVAAPTVPPVGTNISGGLEKYEKGLQSGYEAAKQQGQLEQQAVQSNAAERQNLLNTYNEKSKDIDTDIANTLSDIKNGHIDPNHYISNLSTAGKISTAIGLILGGIGGGLTHQENPAMKFLNDQIGRDIESQKADLGKKETLLSAYYHKFGNLRDATTMTQSVLAANQIDKMKDIAAKTAEPAAKARLLEAAGQIEMQYGPQLQQMKIRQSLQDALQKGGSNIDPAQLVPHLVPADHQKQAFSEIERAQDTKRMSGAILKSFDDATKENTILKTGAGFLRTPGSVYALHQAMQPTFKDLEGTVRQAAMDNTFKNITPAPGDSQHTIDTKKQALMDYLKSKTSAPTAKAYGIDLDRFGSTSTNPVVGLPPQQQQYVQWARQNPNDPRAAIVLKKLGVQ